MSDFLDYNRQKYSVDTGKLREPNDSFVTNSRGYEYNTNAGVDNKSIASNKLNLNYKVIKAVILSMINTKFYLMI